jgi:hypothetical protein
LIKTSDTISSALSFDLIKAKAVRCSAAGGKTNGTIPYMPSYHHTTQSSFVVPVFEQAYPKQVEVFYSLSKVKVGYF